MLEILCWLCAGSFGRAGKYGVSSRFAGPVASLRVARPSPLRCRCFRGSCWRYSTLRSILRPHPVVSLRTNLFRSLLPRGLQRGAGTRGRALSTWVKAGFRGFTVRQYARLSTVGGEQWDSDDPCGLLGVFQFSPRSPFGCWGVRPGCFSYVGPVRG